MKYHGSSVLSYFLLFLSVGFLFSALACSTSHRNPQKWQGRALPQTDDFETAHSVFSISLDGRWLLFESTKGTWREPLFVLYDLEDTRRYSVAAANGVAARLANVSLDGRMAYFDEAFNAFVLPTAALNAFFAISPSRAAEGALIEFEEKAMSRVSSGLPPSAEDLIVVRKISSREAELVTSSLHGAPRSIAQHRLSGALENSIEISDIRASWDRRYLSYRVMGNRGGSFSLNPQGYVVPLDGSRPPVFIGSPVYSPICWHPHGDRFLAYAIDSTGQRAIYSWQLNDLL